MSTPQEKQPSAEKGCKGKANLGRKFRAQADRLSRKHGKRYGVYECPHCQGFHLTTKLQNADRYAPLKHIAPEVWPRTSFSSNMQTDHQSFTRPTTPDERPPFLPLLNEDDFCKAKYSYNDQRCYTARLLDVFLRDEKPYVAAYREFRLASMDYMYHHHKEDHASTGAQRAAGWNAVADSLGYKLVSMKQYQESIHE